MSDVQLPREQRSRRVVDVLHNPITARLILLLAVSLTAAAWYVSRQAVHSAAEQRFEFRTREIESAIHDRMIGYEQVLWGGVGLFNASSAVTRDEWNEYVTTIAIKKHWPGIQGLGFAVPVDPDGVDDHVAAIRAEGFPEYSITPDGVREEYTAIVYLEPFDWRNERAFGFDMWSNDVRREAMSRARDSGSAATSGVITLVQETDEDVQKGFLTYVPVYEDTSIDSVEGRRASFVGWVYAPFRMGDLMHGILGSEVGDVEYELFDGPNLTEEALLYDSNDVFAGTRPTDGSNFQRYGTLEIQGREWTIAFESSPDFIAGREASQPTLIAIGGVIIDLLLFYVISSLGFLQKRARSMAVMTAELKEAKEHLEAHSHELEAYAEQLERSNAELEQFAYVASHDLQEPLRNVGSYSALLADRYRDVLDEDGNRWLGYITNGSQRMSDLLRDLLRYASADADIEPLEPVALDDVLAVVLDDLSEAIEAAGVDIEVEPLPEVLGDASQLQQLFQNLICNAIKYRTTTERPLVAIGVTDLGGEWRIAVRDNGIGIKPDYHERIFEIFRRVGSRNEYPGTGIGLAVCRKVVDRHGGTIGVSSTLGEGSEFWFTLPREPEPTGDQPSRAPAVELAQPV